MPEEGLFKQHTQKREWEKKKGDKKEKYCCCCAEGFLTHFQRLVLVHEASKDADQKVCVTTNTEWGVCCGNATVGCCLQIVDR